MTDKPGGIDPEIIENFGRSLSAIVRRTNWTELRQVKLGAEVGGAQRVKVPEAQRKAPYEVYYRELDNAGYGTAINADAGVPERYDLLVWIGHPPTDKDRWHVFARVTAPELDAATNEPGTQSHASQHSLRNVGFDGGSSVGVVGADPVFVDDRQLSAVAIIPDNGLTVRVTPGWIVFDGARTWFSGSIQDLTTHMPSGTGKALYVLIEIASDLTVYLSDGSEFSFTLPAADLSTYVPASTAGRYQVGAVCLRKTTTQINWTNIWAGLGLRSANTGTLATVEDITISGVADNEVLAYDSGSGDWINQTAAEAGLATAAHAHDAADVTYTPTTATDWDSDADPGDVDEALDQLAERVDDLEGATVDAGDVTYTPTTATDWDSDADPGNVDQALDQLAERVDDLEGAGGGSLTVKEADGTPTVASVTTIVVTNGTLTDDTGGQVTLDFGSAATDGAAIHDNVSGEISAITEKETPVDADLLLIEDSAASYAKKYIEIGNLPGGSGGDSTYTAAYASRPAAGNDGDLFLPSDGFVVERDTGAAWASWGPLYPLTVPVLGDFTWFNQGAATATATNGGIFLNAPAGAGNNIRMLYKAAPSTPYTITVAYLPLLYSINYTYCGIGFRQSSDGKLILFGQNYGNGWKTGCIKYSNASTYNSTYIDAHPLGEQSSGLKFLRIADNGTSRVMSVSADGVNFLPIHTVGRTDYLTADQVFFFAESNNATWAAGMTLLSWKEA